ncbi:MAG: ATP-grasp domain-containing protein [Gammaproteobacteria bacterium]
MPKVALFANEGSPQIVALRDVLLEQGATPYVFDIQLGGESAPLVEIGDERLVWDGVDFDDIEAIHIRCTAPNTPAAVPAVLNVASYSELRSQYLREQEYQSVTASFFDRLAALGKLVINPLTTAYLDHDSKGQLYQKLDARGFPVPRSLMTNDPQRASAFINELGGAIAKPSIGIGSTREITDADLERLDELRACPVLMQEFLIGDTIRVHIVGDSVVLALKILSDGHVDSRTAPKGFEYFKLPDDEEVRIVKATRFLDLHYAAWDIIATEDGRYIYLDCNPGPFIMWIGDENVHRVFTQFAIYMLAYIKTGSVDDASQAVKPWRPG